MPQYVRIGNMNKKDFIKRMGRYSKNKSNLFDVYYMACVRNLFTERWRKHPFIHFKILKKACQQYYKYKHHFIKRDGGYVCGAEWNTNAANLEPHCKEIIEWNPEFREVVIELYLSNYHTLYRGLVTKQPIISKEQFILTDNLRALKSHVVNNERYKHIDIWVDKLLRTGGEYRDDYYARPDRLYTKGMSMQYISKNFRDMLTTDMYDYDIQNCHWTLFAQQPDIPSDYKQLLNEMVYDNDWFMLKIGNEGKQSTAVMKQRRNAVLYGDRSGTGSTILNKIRDRHQHYLKARGLSGSVLSRKLMATEAKVIRTAIDMDSRWSLIMHDGWMSRNKMDLKQVEEQIMYKHNIQVKLKKKQEVIQWQR